MASLKISWFFKVKIADFPYDSAQTTKKKRFMKVQVYHTDVT